MPSEWFQKYAYSADDEISLKHFPDEENYDSLSDEAIDEVISVAKKIWADLMDKNGQMCATRDTIRKAWALTRPDLSDTGSGARHKSDIVVIDEAQDTPPVLAKVVADQKHQRVVVGDAGSGHLLPASRHSGRRGSGTHERQLIRFGASSNRVPERR